MTNAHGVARDQLRAFIERIERLEEEKKTVADDIKDVYGEAKAMGYDTKIMKKVIALRKKDEQERTEEETILDSYLSALGMIPQFEMFEQDEVRPTREQRRRKIMSEDMADHKTLIDEMADAGLISEEAREENKALADAVATKFGNGPAKPLQSPRKAGEAVSERTAFTDATVAPVLVEADKAEAVAGGLGQPDAIPALTVQHDGVNVDGPERAGVTAGETATHSKSEDGAIAAVNPRAGLADAVGVEPSSSVPHPEIENPSPDAELSSAAANAGGDYVTAHQSSAATAGAIVRKAPATFNLRPHCQHRDLCRSGTIDHCHSCKVAMREREMA